MSRKWLRVLWQSLTVIAVVMAVGFWQTRNLASGMAPPLVGLDVHGERLELSAWRGRPVLVHFWATWCPVCALEDDAIQAIARDWPVLTVAMQSGEAREIAAHLRENNLSFPVLVDGSGELSARFGVRAVPTTFVIDGEGRIRFREVGYTTSWGLRLRLWLAGER